MLKVRVIPRSVFQFLPHTDLFMPIQTATIFLDVTPKTTLASLQSQLHTILQCQPIPSPPSSPSSIHFFQLSSNVRSSSAPATTEATTATTDGTTNPSESLYIPIEDPKGSLQTMNLSDGETIALSFQDENGLYYNFLYNTRRFF